MLKTNNLHLNIVKYFHSFIQLRLTEMSTETTTESAEIPKRPPNRPENTETATESAWEYRNGHRIGSRIPNRPKNTKLFEINLQRLISCPMSCTFCSFRTSWYSKNKCKVKNIQEI